MKRLLSIFVVLVMLVSLFPAARAEEESIDNLKQRIAELEEQLAEKDALIVSLQEENNELRQELQKIGVNHNEGDSSGEIIGKWINVNDEDEYLFQDGQSGTHNGISITYQIDENKVIITEGVGSVQTRTLQLDNNDGYLRLIPEDMNTFFVKEDNFDEISSLVKKETATILVSQNLWKCTSTAVLTVYKFYDGGLAALAIPGETMMLSWELIDGNTARLELDRNGEKSVSYVDVVNENGKYSLISNDGTVSWVPYDG